MEADDPKLRTRAKQFAMRCAELVIEMGKPET